jgi:hypothetical protein
MAVGCLKLSPQSPIFHISLIFFLVSARVVSLTTKAVMYAVLGEEPKESTV